MTPYGLLRTSGLKLTGLRNWIKKSIRMSGVCRELQYSSIRMVYMVFVVIFTISTAIHAEQPAIHDADLQAALQNFMMQVQNGKAESLFSHMPEESSGDISVDIPGDTPNPVSGQLSEHEQAQLPDSQSADPEQLPAPADPMLEGAFRTHYLEKFFPRALVIGGGYFPYMTPHQVDLALNDIIALFSNEVWYYFVNDKDRFKQTVFWEYIVDQLSIVHEYLVRYCVDPVEKRVCQHPRGTRGPRLWLFDYLKDYEGSTAIHRFLALSYDWVAKLFVEAIIMEDITTAKSFYKDLAYLHLNLKDSVYEREYSEHLTLARELVDTLKKRLGLTDDQIEGMMSNKQGKFGPGF